jgi:hypothetical protein
MMTITRAGLATAAVLLLGSACAVPIVPQRSRPGGSARWAESLAALPALQWSNDAVLCRVSGAGIAMDGWLPDRGGYWQLTYRSPTKPTLYEVSVDSEGGIQSRTSAMTPDRPCHLNSEWLDSPKVWAATRAHQKSDLVLTFDAELAGDAEPERFPDRPVWRIRFYRGDQTYETHVVSALGEWLTTY